MRGFIALTSVLIISAALMVLVVGASIPMFYARVNMLESEWKAQSAFLAQSCVGVVQLRLVSDPTYSGGEDIEVEGVLCSVSSSTVRISYHGAVTVLHF